MGNKSDSSKNNTREVINGKDKGLKMRLQTLIRQKGISESEFYTKLGMIKQYWYNISWGIWDTPFYLKLKIAKALDTDSRNIWLEEKDD